MHAAATVQRMLATVAVIRRAVAQLASRYTKGAIERTVRHVKNDSAADQQR